MANAQSKVSFWQRIWPFPKRAKQSNSGSPAGTASPASSKTGPADLFSRDSNATTSSGRGSQSRTNRRSTRHSSTHPTLHPSRSTPSFQPNGRRSYTPRHAARDALLTMPAQLPSSVRAGNKSVRSTRSVYSFHGNMSTASLGHPNGAIALERRFGGASAPTPLRRSKTATTALNALVETEEPPPVILRRKGKLPVRPGEGAVPAVPKIQEKYSREREKALGALEGVAGPATPLKDLRGSSRRHGEQRRGAAVIERRERTADAKRRFAAAAAAGPSKHAAKTKRPSPQPTFLSDENPVAAAQLPSILKRSPSRLSHRRTGSRPADAKSPAAPLPFKDPLPSSASRRSSHDAVVSVNGSLRLMASLQQIADAADFAVMISSDEEGAVVDSKLASGQTSPMLLGKAVEGKQDVPGGWI